MTPPLIQGTRVYIIVDDVAGIIRQALELLLFMKLAMDTIIITFITPKGRALQYIQDSALAIHLCTAASNIRHTHSSQTHADTC